MRSNAPSSARGEGSTPGAAHSYQDYTVTDAPVA